MKIPMEETAAWFRERGYAAAPATEAVTRSCRDQRHDVSMKAALLLPLGILVVSLGILIIAIYLMR